MDELLTVKQVAELLQLHEMTIRRYIKSGRLDAVRIGRNVRVPRQAVAELLHTQTLHEAPPIYQVTKKPDAVDTKKRIRSLRRQVEALKREHKNLPQENLWRDLEEVMDQIFTEAVIAGAAIDGDWQGD